MNIDIKGVNSIILVIIIVLVIYCLMRKELFTTAVCGNTNGNETYHPNGSENSNNSVNFNNCSYVGNGKYSCNVETDDPLASEPLASDPLASEPLAANSGD